MLTLAVLRHGSTLWNERGLMQGRRDIPLSARGRSEVGAWCIPSGWPTHVQWVSSPLCRARETARLMTHASPRLEPALTEMDWGEWEGASLETLRTLHGVAFEGNERRGLDFRPPGGESPRDVLERVQRWLQQVAQQRQPVVAVSHKGVLRVLLAAATGWDMTGRPPLKLQPACVHQFLVRRDGGLSLRQCNIPLVAAPDEPSR